MGAVKKERRRIRKTLKAAPPGAVAVLHALDGGGKAPRYAGQIGPRARALTSAVSRRRSLRRMVVADSPAAMWLHTVLSGLSAEAREALPRVADFALLKMLGQYADIDGHSLNRETLRAVRKAAGIASEVEAETASAEAERVLRETLEGAGHVGA